MNGSGHVLPDENNLLQDYITYVVKFVSVNKMKINKQKTKVISFTKSRKWDFPPEIHFSDGTQLEYISETKLVGVVISQDLRWQKNTDYICQKARAKLWILRRLLKVDLDIHQLYDVYCKEIRSIFEMAVPVWHAGLTKQQSKENVQKAAMKIILQGKYASYQLACSTFLAQTLEERRLQLCNKFASKTLKSDISFFSSLKPNVHTRQKSDLVKEFKCNTKRYQKSSLPFLAYLLNSTNSIVKNNHVTCG